MLFIKRLDDQHTTREKKSVLLQKPIENPIYSDEQQHSLQTAPLPWLFVLLSFRQWPQNVVGEREEEK
ncbi:hypothetical protein [Runella rosea]|uniref:hypothetical protein n=1 Tax=Runella rosea TaxID=2259595 RepID=UPI0035B5FDB8